MNNQYILIIDFGSQYTKLVARRMKDIGAKFIISSWEIKKKELLKKNIKGILLSGSPMSVLDDKSPYVSKDILNMKVPILGICYGMHTLVKQLGGKVERKSVREFGYASIKILKNHSNLFYDNFEVSEKNYTKRQKVWMSHEDSVINIPKGFSIIASTKNCKYAAIFNKKNKFYGVQFHPEVTHSEKGYLILNRFVKNICNYTNVIKYSLSIRKIILKIKNKVNDEKVILGLSGGIDSFTSAILIHKAIGNNLFCICIDNGLLRNDEILKIKNLIKKVGKINVIYINHKKRFLKSLNGITDPEKKRKTIGNLFFKIFQEQADILKAKWLAQGTIYPDIIESSQNNLLKKDNFIKSHHNVCPLPKGIKLKILEPLKHLFKDEVKKIAKKIGIPKEIIFRHPFPGPGLAVRIIGEIKEEYCNILRMADEIFISELKSENLYFNISQAFSVLLPIKSVAVMGDMRKYEWVISLRAIETLDFMSANWANIPYKILNNVSNRIINEVRGISRVVYDISNKPPSTIEWE
ncbi:guaA [Wigglesworthia glossinidia endosymbiont of Glossina brevipalpis]|uniref:GMP synthase [glutamine-hydrolyzing] n=1 Tax=Wigglesworthia glossinidia brevipalpis TaxID=36870 RepID=GUAA_WIGBR|nr:RecName: Full=GMP synthase [glutamine-hydrolyzing]; AltName: Full=GMP synthetase; AltName: Full=Glutamine amidotransferase [Wigglesworthia glossinidia endosymbiont of Glossina brevipalpis]BAC24752.1 guaA [Wigglesworthia glossinidia endosymbiont of Glossina brevipalpis]